MKQLCGTLNRLRPMAPLVLRVIIGGLFVWHGIDKFNAGIGMVEGMFEMWGVPLPGITAPLVAVVEIVGGLALIVGLMTRPVAGVLSIVMFGALVFVKLDMGLIPMDAAGAEVDLAYLAGLIALMAFGPGPYSADSMMGLEVSEEEVTADRVAVAA
jgi:putative oxidoreductase